MKEKTMLRRVVQVADTVYSSGKAHTVAYFKDLQVFSVNFDGIGRFYTVVEKGTNEKEAFDRLLRENGLWKLETYNENFRKHEILAVGKDEKMIVCSEIEKVRRALEIDNSLSQELKGSILENAEKSGRSGEWKGLHFYIGATGIPILSDDNGNIVRFMTLDELQITDKTRKLRVGLTDSIANPNTIDSMLAKELEEAHGGGGGSKIDVSDGLGQKLTVCVVDPLKGTVERVDFNEKKYDDVSEYLARHELPGNTLIVFEHAAIQNKIFDTPSQGNIIDALKKIQEREEKVHDDGLVYENRSHFSAITKGEVYPPMTLQTVAASNELVFSDVFHHNGAPAGIVSVYKKEKPVQNPKAQKIKVIREKTQKTNTSDETKSNRAKNQTLRRKKEKTEEIDMPQPKKQLRRENIRETVSEKNKEENAPVDRTQREPRLMFTVLNKKEETGARENNPAGNAKDSSEEERENKKLKTNTKVNEKRGGNRREKKDRDTKKDDDEKNKDDKGDDNGKYTTNKRKKDNEKDIEKEAEKNDGNGKQRLQELLKRHETKKKNPTEKKESHKKILQELMRSLDEERKIKIKTKEISKEEKTLKERKKPKAVAVEERRTAKKTIEVQKTLPKGRAITNFSEILSRLDTIKQRHAQEEEKRNAKQSTKKKVSWMKNGKTRTYNEKTENRRSKLVKEKIDVEKTKTAKKLTGLRTRAIEKAKKSGAKRIGQNERKKRANRKAVEKILLEKLGKRLKNQKINRNR